MQPPVHTPVQTTITAAAAPVHKPAHKPTAKPAAKTPPQSTYKLVPLKWGKWPSEDAELEVEGVPGVWAFIEPMPCGSEYLAVLVAPWDQREEVRRAGSMLNRNWVIVERVRVRVSPDVRR